MTSFSPLTLSTARLTLRFITADDALDLFDIFSDGEAMRYWSSGPWQHPAQAGDNVRETLQAYADGSALRFGIVLNATEELIGTVTLYRFDRRNHRCDIGYLLARQHWGQRYMNEALHAVIEYGFRKLELHRIEADIHPDNIASARLLERLHFRYEGHLRQRWFVHGEISDSLIFGLLRPDWNIERHR
ncbi:MAG: GNAT family N-acetyltransferase [Sphingomonadaceae bacterium]